MKSSFAENINIIFIKIWYSLIYIGIVKSMEIKKITESLINRIIHDLIGPVGMIGISAEIDDKENMEKSIEQAILRMEIFRFIFKSTNKKPMLLIEKLNEYIKNKEIAALLNESYPNCLMILIFWLIEKSNSRSEMNCLDNSIQLKHFFIKEEEINALSGSFEDLNAQTIFPAMAYFYFKNEYKLEVQKTEENNWEILIKSINT